MYVFFEPFCESRDRLFGGRINAYSSTPQAPGGALIPQWPPFPLASGATFLSINLLSE
jgi:hypothetical protein